MAAFVALVRAVNVGGTGKLPMSRTQGDRARRWDLPAYAPTSPAAMWSLPAANPKPPMKKAHGNAAASLRRQACRRVGTQPPRRWQAILKDNPFPRAAPNRNRRAYSSISAPPRDTLAARSRPEGTSRSDWASARSTSTMATAWRQSKLVVPAARTGTARNMNTVANARKDGRRFVGVYGRAITPPVIGIGTPVVAG